MTGMARTPWADLYEAGWRIVGMNHYRLSGAWNLYVAMTRDGRCIQAEGADEMGVFDQLRRLAMPPGVFDELRKLVGPKVDHVFTETKRQCKDGGACHHECKEGDCYRERCCAPLSGSGLGDDWKSKVEPGAPLRIDPAAGVIAWESNQTLKGGAR